MRLQISEPADESIVNTATIRVSGMTNLDAVVSVNGSIVDVADNGGFTTNLNLLEGPNLIEVIATDIEGRQAAQNITIIFIP